MRKGNTFETETVRRFQKKLKKSVTLAYKNIVL